MEAANRLNEDRRSPFLSTDRTPRTTASAVDVVQDSDLVPSAFGRSLPGTSGHGSMQASASTSSYCKE